MEPEPGAAQPGQGEVLEALLRRALWLDLEVSQQGRILRLGAVLRERTLAQAGGLAGGRDEFYNLAAAARCLLGHNLVRHDLPFLRGASPGHPALRLPVIDTLVLSPIAFPENPYHRLVKDYKLVKESANDPVADARQAAALFADEFRSLAGLRQTEPGLFAVLHYLLATADTPDETLAQGMGLLFNSLGGTRPPRAQALELCRELFRRWGCASVRVDEALVQTTPQRLAVAYAVAWLRVAGANSVLPPWVRLEHPQTGQLIELLRENP